MSRAVVAIVGIVLVGVVGIWGLQAAVADAGVNKDVDGETFTPDPGNITVLDHSHLDHTHYDDTVEVYDNNGELMDPVQDYVWYPLNGTILTVEGGDLDGENSGTIDYRYQTTTENQRALANIVAIMPRIMAVLVPLLGVALLLLFVKG